MGLHVQQLQQEAQTAGALEYCCEGLLQEKQQLAQQLQHLQGTPLSLPCTTAFADSLTLRFVYPVMQYAYTPCVHNDLPM